jgi:hypothetical protein
MLLDTRRNMKGLHLTANRLLEAKMHAVDSLKELRTVANEFVAQLDECQNDANWVFYDGDKTSRKKVNSAGLRYKEVCTALGCKPAQVVDRIFEGLSPTLLRMTMRAPGWDSEWPFCNPSVQ